MPILDWIRTNLKSKSTYHLDMSHSWSLLFVVSLWQIWKAHNRKSFDNVETTNTECFKIALAYAKKIGVAFKEQRSCHRLINWLFSLLGEIKLKYGRMLL
ncbi:hypothetical protein RHMOL_Rhmol01G0119000 [Rhododendron molle]|nr:hypothetical protein RHMOL_Rhmol01G0119000 [Rhododendron molle]